MKCILCGKNREKIFKALNGINIYECKFCKLGFINQSDTKNLTSNHLYSYSEYQKNEKELKKRFLRLLKIIRKYKKEGCVLDVGGGFGLFSSILQSRSNYKVDLLEPINKPRYIQNSKINHIREYFQIYASHTKKKYDLIIMLDIIEHFNDPLKALRNARKLLKSDGIFILQTPNYQSLMQYLCKNWSWWMIKDHKFFFSSKSIRLMHKKIGFHIKSLISYEDFNDFKKNLDGNFTNIKFISERRIKKLLFFSIFIPIYFCLKEVIWRMKKGGLIFTISSYGKFK